MRVLGIINSLLFKGEGKKSLSQCPFTLFLQWNFFFHGNAQGLDMNKTALCWVLFGCGVEGRDVNRRD